MAPPSTKVVYRRIAAELRAAMLNGKMPPGTRFPTREALMQRYGTTSVTVQKAFDLLIDQGWVRAEGRRGTFVNGKMPDHRHYALAFRGPRNDNSSQFYRAIQKQATQLSAPQRQISCFYEISGRTDTEDYERLADLVYSHSLAGVIFANHPHEVKGLPVLEEPGVPRVVIASAWPGVIPTVYPDLDGFYTKAFDTLAAAGRRRVAVLTLTGAGPGVWALETLPQLAAARGLRIERRWVQAAPLGAPQWARQAAELLCQGTATHRPDALLITDDNLVPEATAGLRAAGVRGGSDLLVIAHTNFPYPTPAAVPVTRLGYDISRLLAQCVERIDQQRRGEGVPQHTSLPVVIQGELAAAGSQAA